jgi:NAD+ kinase
MESLRHFGYPSIPVFGANFGSVGFLMNTKDSLRDLPRAIERWEFSSEEHAVLEARTHGEDGAEHRLLAFNDVVVERMTRQSLRLEIALDGAAFHQYAGDGFILSTTAGSTAYNLAAGGPVVHPSLDVMIITPLYPHRASPFHSIQFSLVVPLASTVRIVALDLPKRRMRVVADGEAIDLASSVEITASGDKVNLLRPSSHIFVQTLTRKFIGE